MNKSLLIMVLVLFTMAINAQNRVHFTLSKSCTYVKPNSDTSYYIFNYEGESQASLYNKALIGVTKTFVSAKDVVSKVENSLISINSTHVLSYTIGGIIPTKNYVNYVVEIEFKEGRIKVNAPTIVGIRNAKGELSPSRDFILSTTGELGIGWEMYLFTNDVINSILANLDKKSSEDW
jgi:hypothetical protein